jgi:hypothetical protein
MKTHILLVFAVFSIMLIDSGCKQKKSILSEEDFLGEWYTIRGDVEAYSFLKDSDSYIYLGTQNMRPVVFGTWKIVKDKFIIIPDNGNAIAYSYLFKNDTLTFNEGEEIYTRTIPLEIKYPETKILLNLSRDFSNLKFSPPVPSDLNWGFTDNRTHSFKKIKVKGYSITTSASVSSNLLNKFSDYLKDCGFEPDTTSVISMCTGFLDYDQIVTICIGKQGLSPIDSVSILITCGIIEDLNSAVIL